MAQKPPASPTYAKPPVSIAHAKANFSSIIASVEQGHQPVTISRRGIPVALVIPFPTLSRPKLGGSMAGTVTELGDIVSSYLDEWTVNEPEEDDEDD